jgi:hypothetical protein|tara:strand:- start:281 stop:481 length:201 start_codon:yes stop_codon:yes gene_type:complete
MIMAFLLVVTLGDIEAEEEEDFLFKDITRCNYFAYNIEHNYKGLKQLDISAYCIPKMVSNDSIFWD